MRELEEFIQQTRDQLYADLDNRLAAARDGYEKDAIVDQSEDQRYYVDEVYPAILRSSVLIGAYSCLERSMISVCEKLHKQVAGSPPPRFQSSIIVMARRYVDRHLALGFSERSPRWLRILRYNKIRNVIVHNGGRFTTEQKRAMRSFLRKENLVAVDVRRFVVLQQGFCEKAIDTFERFFVSDFAGRIPKHISI